MEPRLSQKLCELLQLTRQTDLQIKTVKHREKVFKLLILQSCQNGGIFSKPTEKEFPEPSREKCNGLKLSEESWFQSKIKQIKSL